MNPCGRHKIVNTGLPANVSGAAGVAIALGLGLQRLGCVGLGVRVGWVAVSGVIFAVRFGVRRLGCGEPAERAGGAAEAGQ